MVANMQKKQESQKKHQYAVLKSLKKQRHRDKAVKNAALAV